MRNLLTALLLLVSTCAFALHTPETNTFLYKISKHNQADSYLLGTIHIGKNGNTLPTTYLDTLNKVSRLVLESDLTHKQTNPALSQLIHDERPLRQSLGETRFRKLQALFHRNKQTFPFHAQSQIKPWVVWMSAATQLLPQGYSSEYGTDLLLLNTAKQQNKSIHFLESLEPFFYFNELPEAAINRSLDSWMKHPQSFLNDTQKLARQYQRQQAQALWADTNDVKQALRFVPKQDLALWKKLMFDQLLYERTRSWQPTLIKLLPQESTLIAVGAAHLFGEHGLIHLLQQTGYTISPIHVQP